jgi:hypothetical protein
MGSFLGAAFGAPSSQVMALNNQIQSFSQSMTQQAKAEGIAASTTFNNLMTPLQRIVQGGPSQAGWSQSQFNAYNTSVIQRAAAAARDEKAVIGSSVPGGPSVGNTGTQGVNTAAIADKAEQYASAAEAEGIQQDYEAGRKNFTNAVSEEKSLPGVFATSNEANRAAAEEQQTAEKSQQSIDTAKNWWQPLVVKGALGAAGAATGLPLSTLAPGGNGKTPGSGFSMDAVKNSPVGKLFGGGGDDTPAQSPDAIAQGN